MLLAALLMCGFAPIHAIAAGANSVPSDQTHPRVMKAAGDDVANAHVASLQPFATPIALASTAPPPNRPNREIFGFALASSLGDSTIGYPSWNFSLLTTVAFFGLHVQDDGNFANDSGASVWNSSQLTGLVNAAHAHGTRVLLTIILQDFSAGTPHMCSGLAHAGTTVAYAAAEVRAKGVDGINVDYEGLNGSCGTGDSSWARHALTNMVQALRSQITGAAYLSVDTYASSAKDPLGFFDVAGLASSSDSLFVMSYDLEYSNWSRPPTNCSSFCLGPTAPLNGYYYNDTSTASQYVSVIPASKVILGVPYYGRKSCVAGATPNQYPTSSVVADTYLDASGEAGAPEVLSGSYMTHRDANDPAGQERWDTWVNTTLNCTRELYWDDTTSLGQKYDLVNNDNLAGAGIWNLNYGGGAAELWQLLQNKFATAWTSLGGALSAVPDSTSWGANRLDVFSRDANNALIHTFWNGSTWSAFESLGGVITSGPGAVSWGPNRIDVFARGQDNGTWHKWWNGSAWSGWYPLGGVATSGPDVASWSSGRLDVFIRGQDNGLWHTFWGGSSWSSWESLGGVLTSDPSAVSWGPNRIDVFARGQDNGLWHLAWNGSRWSGWQSLGGILTSGPDVSSCAPGHLDVFALGGSSALFQLGFNGYGWSGWLSLGGQWSSDPGAVCMAGLAASDLFERGTDNALWHARVLGF